MDKKQFEINIIMQPDGHVDIAAPVKPGTKNMFEEKICIYMIQTALRLIYKHNKKLEEKKKSGLVAANGQKI